MDSESRFLQTEPKEVNKLTQHYNLVLKSTSKMTFLQTRNENKGVLKLECILSSN